ncbi:MAG TPA: hypothetical protein PKK23_01745 [Nitrospirales bacterium]|nr:hypothetical protein [Nitrospirales bacterium]
MGEEWVVLGEESESVPDWGKGQGWGWDQDSGLDSHLVTWILAGTSQDL